MTMNREAKEAMLKRNVEILIGAEKILSPSPRRAAEFGRYAPAEWAARFELRRARRTKNYVSRECVIEGKIRARRRAGRTARTF
jgi:hypothetical protein